MRDAAKKQSADWRVASAARDDQIGTDIVSDLDEHMRRSSENDAADLKGGRDALVRELLGSASQLRL